MSLSFMFFKKNLTKTLSHTLINCILLSRHITFKDELHHFNNVCSRDRYQIDDSEVSHRHRLHFLNHLTISWSTFDCLSFRFYFWQNLSGLKWKEDKIWDSLLLMNLLLGLSFICCLFHFLFRFELFSLYGSA